MIDTLEITKRLLKAKDDKTYAETLAEILRESEEFHFHKLATKDDINNLRKLLVTKFKGLMYAISALAILNAGVLYLLLDMVKCVIKN